MCGIAGWIETAKTPTDPAIAARMADAIAHRGPDGEGSFAESLNTTHVALIHRRLAVIDLAGGAQPMGSVNGHCTLSFNGEIYNFQALRAELRALGHEFLTASDTEVLLHAYAAWGADCVRRLNGMFAFALWDRARGQLLLARDPFGEKPLFLWQQASRLLFASEIKALLAHPAVTKRLDPASVRDYLQYRYVPAPHTLFEGITKLPPGTYGIWKDGAFTIHSYYVPPDAGAGEPPAAASPEDFLPLLEDSVRLRMIADVPFGAFLSGGIDSSAIVALMSRASSRPITSFSVGFAEGTYSELEHARAVAAHFGTRHHELIFRPQDVETALAAATRHRDAPVSEPSDLPLYLLAKEAATQVKMVLTGEAADELLAGYPKHSGELAVLRYQRRMPERLHRAVVVPFLNCLPMRDHRLRTMTACLGLRNPKERWPRWFGALSPAESGELLALRAPVRDVASGPFAGTASPLRRLLHFDQTSWLPDNLLERCDRMTMASGLEARLPFLDTRIAALLSRLPDSARLRRGTRKRLLRRTMKTILPDTILARRKWGFRLPMGEWLREPLKDFVHDRLLAADAATLSFYRRERVEAILREHQKKRTNHEKLIWTLLALEQFQREYRLA